MALIKCSECGKEISSNAQMCPNCGNPIASCNPNGDVAIKITNGLAGKVKIINMETNELLWLGRAGEIARFKVNGPTNIGIKWGIGGDKIPTNRQICVKARERYEFVMQTGFFWSDYCFNRIDVIDSF